MQRRSGFYRTNLPGRAQYESFVPAPLPPQPPLESNAQISDLTVGTRHQLARLNQLTAKIKYPDFFLPLLLGQEAFLSIRTEGAELDRHQVLAEISPAVADLKNYARALALGLDLLQELPLCLRLLRQVHSVLLAEASYEQQSPGEFRRSQNWLGDKDSSIQTAWYVPPSVEDMTRSLADLEEYIHAEDKLDDLLRAGLVHYQFFAIHPFLAGNNRTNRILTYLYLVEKKLLASPVLALSFHFSQNRSDYYKKMLAVYNRGSYEEWLIFFLAALKAAAARSCTVLARLISWQARQMAWLEEMGRAGRNTGRLLAWFLCQQSGQVKEAARDLNLARSTVARAVQRLLKAGLLEEEEADQGPRTYFAKESFHDLFCSDC